MGEWATVKWTEARQITAAMGMDGASNPSAGVDPQSFYRTLRDAGDLNAAISYLGLALPRFEAVAWAAHTLQERAKSVRLPPLDRQALERVLRWLEEPTDDFRRAAYEAAERATPKGPENMLGLAVFMSGGSLGPPDLPAVNPPQDVCGRVAAAAILIAAHKAEKPEAVMASALDTGERIAAEGLRALASR